MKTRLGFKRYWINIVLQLRSVASYHLVAMAKIAKLGQEITK